MPDADLRSGEASNGAGTVAEADSLTCLCVSSDVKAPAVSCQPAGRCRRSCPGHGSRSPLLPWLLSPLPLATGR